MPESFELPVAYNGQELVFPSELITTGYTHRIKVIVNRKEFFFEPDEERNYRAVMYDTEGDQVNESDKYLLQAIAETLHHLFHR